MPRQKTYTVSVKLTATIMAESCKAATDCLWDLLTSDYAFDSDQVLEVHTAYWRAKFLPTPKQEAK